MGEVADKKAELRLILEGLSEHFAKVYKLINKSERSISLSKTAIFGFGLSTVVTYLINNSINWTSLGCGALIATMFATKNLIYEGGAQKEKQAFIESKGISEEDYVKLASVGMELGKQLMFLEKCKAMIEEQRTKIAKYCCKIENKKGKCGDRKCRKANKAKTKMLFAGMSARHLEEEVIPSLKVQLMRTGVIKELAYKDEDYIYGEKTEVSQIIDEELFCGEKQQQDMPIIIFISHEVPSETDPFSKD